MTRRDLEEAVLNLEYLLAHHFNPNKTAEYDKQLQIFRCELQVLNQQQCDSQTAITTKYKHRIQHWLQR